MVVKKIISFAFFVSFSIFMIGQSPDSSLEVDKSKTNCESVQVCGLFPCSFTCILKYILIPDSVEKQIKKAMLYKGGKRCQEMVRIRDFAFGGPQTRRPTIFHLPSLGAYIFAS